jgi:hypothetical protein
VDADLLGELPLVEPRVPELTNELIDLGLVAAPARALDVMHPSLSPDSEQIGNHGVHRTLTHTAQKDILRQQFWKRMGDLSQYFKELKQRFSQWHNLRHGRRGTLWEERFKSVLIGADGSALTTVAAYIDLNPVRAGLVTNPSLYRWSGYGQAMAGRPEALAGYQSLTAIREGSSLKPAQALKHYRAGLFDYAERRGVFPPAQACIKPDIKRRSPQTLHPWQQHGDFGLIGQLLHRIRYFSDGAVIGSKNFVESMALYHQNWLQKKRQPSAHPLSQLKNSTLFSLRPLRNRAIG